MANILFIVSVAPVYPYPELYESGPKSTWAKKLYPEAQIHTYSGEIPSKLVKQLSDFRDMLRYPEAQTGYLGTVDYSSLLLRIHGRIAHARQGQRSTNVLTKTRALSARYLLQAMALVIQKWERKVTSFLRNRKKFRVTFFDNAYHVSHPSTMSGSLGIQLSVMQYLLDHEDFDGVFFTTASAYVDVDRAVKWAKNQSEEVIFAGGNALRELEPETPLFLSGFFQYFSNRAVDMIVNAKDFDHSKMNDEALTAWLLKHNLSWKELSIAWSPKELELGICPLCTDVTKIVVRCTEHGARNREKLSMMRLDHCHKSIDLR